MIRVFLAATLLFVLSPKARADEAAISLLVRPMPAPIPVLRYQLLPELAELNPGNPAQNYLKCFMEQHQFFYGKQSVADRARYQVAPLAELASAKLRGYGSSALRQADWAARLDAIDWQALPQIQQGGIDTVPGDLGPLQLLAAALHVRFRAEVAGRRFDDAVRSAKTMFALARHLGEHPTVVANLIGLSVAHLGLNTLEEMVQQPGCPNLYWALTDLPCPLVDLRKGIRGDRTMVAAELRRLRHDIGMSDAELEALVSRVSGAAQLCPRTGRLAAKEHAGRSAGAHARRGKSQGRPAAPGRGRLGRDTR